MRITSIMLQYNRIGKITVDKLEGLFFMLYNCYVHKIWGFSPKITLGFFKR